MSEIRYGILIDPSEAALIIDLINTHIEQLKSKIRAEGLSAEKYRDTFLRLINMRKRIEYFLKTG